MFGMHYILSRFCLTKFPEAASKIEPEAPLTGRMRKAPIPILRTIVYPQLLLQNAIKS